MPRPTKLTPDTQAKIIQRLSAGSTIKATCDSVGIHVDTYYEWLKRGNEAKSGIYSDFSEATTRAQADGLIHAAIQFRNGMNPSEIVAETTETFVETRIRKVKHADGSTEEVPYQYERTVKRDTVTHNPGDWRAAMEYLARRDPESWARQAAQKHDISHDGKLQIEYIYPDNDHHDTD